MSDEDDYDPLDDEWWGFAKEEPDCYACADIGCRVCQPTRLDIWLRSIRWRFSILAGKLRIRRPNDDEMPF